MEGRTRRLRPTTAGIVIAILAVVVLAVDQFRVGNEAQARGFVHAQLRLLSGRSAEVKHDLSERIAKVLREFVPRPAGMLVQLSVEVVDMDRGSYVKERLPAA